MTILWLMMICVLVMEVKSKSELPASMPVPTQQFWAPSSRVQATPASDKSGGVATARGFFGHSSTAAQQSQNTLQSNNPVDMYLKHRQVGYRNTGFLTGKAAPALPPTFNRLPTTTNNVHGRFGGFNLPSGVSPAPLAVPGNLAASGALQQHSGYLTAAGGGQQHAGYLTAAGGGQQYVGFHGVKSALAPGFFHNPRDSRIYENYKPRDPLKKTGTYIIPTPSTLYYDGVKQQ